MTLQHLSVRNFQCHRKLEIDFDPLITTIVGRSDVGKSSIIRALRWLISNRPAGSHFLRHGTDSCRVTLLVSDIAIRRVRTKRANFFDMAGQRFVALGNSVPDTISQFLNVGSVSFQLQHDAAFWLSDSPGTVSKNLNAIIDLSKIDSTLANIASQLRKARTAVEVSEERYDQAKKQRAELRWVRQVDKKLRKLAEQQEVITHEQLRCDRLQFLIQGIKRSRQVCQRLRVVLEAAQRVNQLGERVQQEQERVQCLQKILIRIRELKNQVKQEQADVSKLESGLAEKLEGKCPLCLQTLPRRLLASSVLISTFPINHR